MPNMIEEILTSALVGYLVAHRPTVIGSSVPIHVSNRDFVRKRPCIVFEAPESKRVPAMKHTSIVKVVVHVFSQVHDTSADTHGQIARGVEDLFENKATLKTELNSATFLLHDIILRESSTSPDEENGRVTVLTYEVVVSAV
jgi:hypothetical protein